MMKLKVLQMMEIELELTSNCKEVIEILEKISQLVKRSQELGFEMTELEIGLKIIKNIAKERRKNNLAFVSIPNPEI
jgi:hypothetical protein